MCRSVCKSRFSLANTRTLVVIILYLCNVIIDVPKSFYKCATATNCISPCPK